MINDEAAKRKQLAILIKQCDANAVQARKDGRVDACLQWQELAIELQGQAADLAIASVKGLLEAN